MVFLKDLVEKFNINLEINESLLNKGYGYKLGVEGFDYNKTEKNGIIEHLFNKGDVLITLSENPITLKISVKYPEHMEEAVYNDEGKVIYMT